MQFGSACSARACRTLPWRGEGGRLLRSIARAHPGWRDIAGRAVIALDCQGLSLGNRTGPARPTPRRCVVGGVLRTWCARCDTRLAVPALASSRGPAGPYWALLWTIVAFLGWFGGAAVRPADAQGLRWSAPVRLSALGEEVALPQVAINGRGEAIAAWEVEGAHPGDEPRGIRVAMRLAGGRWVRSLRITGTGIGAPVVAIDDSGDRAVAYMSRGAGLTVAVTRHGVRFRHPQRMEARDLVTPFVLRANPSGTFLLAWQVRTGHAKFTRAALAVGGSRFERPVTLETVPPSIGQFTNVELPVAALADDGSAAVAWARDHMLRLARRLPGGSFAAPQTVAEVSNLDTPAPVAAGGPLLALAWLNSATGAHELTLGPGAEQTAADVPDSAPLPATRSFPSVAVSPAGRVTLTWNNEQTTVAETSQQADGTFPAPHVIARDDALLTVQLAFTADGRLVAVSDANDQLNATVTDITGQPSQPVRIDRVAPLHGCAATVADEGPLADGGHGALAIAWQQFFKRAPSRCRRPVTPAGEPPAPIMVSTTT
jgi:hypothetical protein